MIVSKTPLRISLFGGGSDIPAYYKKFRIGSVMSCTIDRYIRIATQRVQSDHVKVMYSQVEQVKDVSELQHALVKECLKEFRETKNIEIASFADVPTDGTGLGSSSTFTVGLIKALTGFEGWEITRSKLAELACEIEIERCGAKIGKQDQYAAAFGGFNIINFHEHKVVVRPIECSWQTLSELNQSLYLISLGTGRKASSILAPTVALLEQEDHKVTTAITGMIYNLLDAVSMLQGGHIHQIGHILDECWELKKQMTPGAITPEIEQRYFELKKHGVIGGKVLGAGGGGYLLVYVPAENDQQFHDYVIETKCRPEQFNFTDEGSRIVYNDER